MGEGYRKCDRWQISIGWVIAMFILHVRVWFVRRSTSEAVSVTTIGCLDFAPTHADMTMPNLLKQINKKLKDKPLQGEEHNTAI